MPYERKEKLTTGQWRSLREVPFMYIPGCVEHYLVHIMRGHEDFIPELDFVLELDGRIIGNIMYTKARLVDEAGEEKKYQPSQDEFYIMSQSFLE